MTDRLASATPPVPSASQAMSREGIAATVPAPDAFAINFARSTVLPPRVRRLLAWFILIYVLAHLLACFALFSTTLWTYLDARRLERRLGAAGAASTEPASRQTMADLRAQAGLQTTQLHAMSAQLAMRFPVGAKLAALTTTLPARTWVTGLEAKRDAHTLTIRAAYLIDPEHPYELPTTRWIETLKADPAFGHGLKRLDLQGSSRKTQGRAELFVFTLSAEWVALQ